MGCDIHIVAEQFNEEGGRWELVSQGDEVYDGRNYNLFAMLAGVRNYHDIVPISAPRGVPEDASPEAKAFVDDYGDGHSHSWFTVAEMDAYDWQQVVTESGWVALDNYKAWRENGAKGPPSGWCAGVSGRDVEHLTRFQADRVLDGKESRYELYSYYVPLEWTRTYAECVKCWLEDTMPKLRAMGPADKVRVVFFFDS